jgi:hypothetical protein
MNNLIIHKVNIAHYRLIELTKIADQTKPFYDWVEKQAKRITGDYHSFSEILLTCPKTQIAEIITACYKNDHEEKPLLFDGIGRVYPHNKACFFFFAWIIRDAPQQRLAPLISQMQKLDGITKMTAEIDTLVALILEYRSIVKSFDWAVIREIIIDRLEGSRRSISGHRIEAHVRMSVVIAIQHYYTIYGNYGKFKGIEIANKQLKLGSHTIDVAVHLTPKEGNNQFNLLIPVKTRETQGGGHSHLFSRDIITAINDIKKTSDKNHIVFVIIAEQWSATEIANINNQIDMIFHFNMNPNQFLGFDEESQIQFNKYVERLLKEDN